MDSNGWDARYAAAPDLVWSREPNRFVVEELAGLPPGRAIDLAAGEGRNALWLAERGWQVTAVDFSGVAIDRGRKLAEEHGLTVEWLVADLTGYVPPKAAFDLVLIAYLQLPPDQMADVLRKAAVALAPGGTLLLVGHDVTNLADGIGGPQDATVLHSPESVTAVLPGLRIERAETVRRPVPTDDGVKDALDTLVRAVRDQS